MAYDALFDSVFARMDPERIHERAFAAIRAGRPVSRLAYRVEPSPVTVMGIEFPHRFGLAAGFDKNARGVLGLLALGFGHVEIGTVTAKPQPGNEKPRLFRLVDDHAIVNRMGFNNDGAAEVASRLHRLRGTDAGRRAVIGVNIGKTKVVPAEHAAQDYVESARLLAPYADYLVVNVSSPNTPGLRDLQAVESLEPILAAVKAVADGNHGGRVPLVVKIAPDLADEDVDRVTDLVLALGLDGISATNTTIARPDDLRTPRSVVEAAGAGGLSGPVLADRALEVLRAIRSRAGDGLTLIGVGGVTDVADVRTRIEAGADLVQGYTGFIYGGPSWPSRLARVAR
ncbi:quinone-dependent dihydroorotate dehydrogenase [Aeromicrobium duanguangcaii]|uniref:Dihydroorotate dehydrogenase (quinone) n=1 Tax=Aeromicrobium duanguangcaii TaxID=2968086 RepID=A0ABY5KEQ9_9ACTN|nr:quinone-dependent dihydroorotate dehydrogenase [Aeromicrobium duanguangcaii]MCD9153985.1 quinone-dependent dihydroorotate dehydrogenase [Aeromicrobium duanguangcaii]UUI68937.1 quinone-dependent dihydroorotate dehydrogenase [Aeromicrobium duanguangcaii]